MGDLVTPGSYRVTGTGIQSANIPWDVDVYDNVMMGTNSNKITVPRVIGVIKNGEVAVIIGVYDNSWVYVLGTKSHGFTLAAMLTHT